MAMEEKKGTFVLEKKTQNRALISFIIGILNSGNLVVLEALLAGPSQVGGLGWV